MKPIPLLSFTLLLMSYSIFGWSLANAQVSLFLYLVVIACIFLLDVILTFRLLDLKAISPWFQSDIFTFISAILIAFLFVVFIRWINIFIHALVLVSAGILAKLDTQVYGLKKWQSFGILLIISEGSLFLGTALYILIKNYK
ncbi:MAG: hypothetical protein F6K22_03075 [Okeania sp. SIO2F4]|uniref:hypothetical protein n=1 Tax=Okeania sp. SIO2F4 TaxID=2607790 RepID=UPI00142C8A51|nr:hypothetical protein [Okeania sp. SIO2F4]MDJ0515305.1 hypothetical protein [Trichodesmium sp. MO_231.B1]NES01897.1 hypothetical protein [Okeania sp. SIO2F4]